MILLIGNKLNEEIARKAFLDVKYNKFIRKSINKEKKRLYKIFDENDIKYFLSETNYIFINPNKSREVFANELEKHNYQISLPKIKGESISISISPLTDKL